MVGGFFKNLFGVKSPAVGAIKQPDGSYFYPFSFPKFTQDTKTIHGQISAYGMCSPVSTVVNRMAAGLQNGRWWVLDEKGDEVVNKDVQRLLNKPNPLQSWNQFIAQARGYQLLFGEAFIHAVAPIGFDASRAKALWVLPNWIVDVKLSGKYWSQFDKSEIITGYSVNVNEQETELEIKHILHIKDIHQNLETPIIGRSRLYSLGDPVSNILAAYEARNVLITRKGALGILSNESKDVAGTIPVEQSEKEQIQRDFQKYGLTREQYQIIITNANLKWQTMTFPTKDLMLFEEIEDDTRAIADAYGYPMHLLGYKAGSTFNNVSEAKKVLYQDVIIPDAESFAQSLNEFFGIEKGRLQVFFDHLDILQQSEKEKADAFLTKNQAYRTAYESGAITLEEWRIGIDYDPDNFTGNTFYNGSND